MSMGRPCRPLSHIIIKYPTGGCEPHLHQLGQVFGEPAAIKYKECTGTIEIEKYMEDFKEPEVSDFTLPSWYELFNGESTFARL